MFKLSLDWEQKIKDLCDQYELDTDRLNEDDRFKEMIADALGFSSFASFQAFPNPREIIGGMGNPIVEEYLTYVPALLDDCCKEIQRRWLFDRDEEIRLRQTETFLQYILSSELPMEFTVASIVNMKTNYDFPYTETKSWGSIKEQYGDLI